MSKSEYTGKKYEQINGWVNEMASEYSWEELMYLCVGPEDAPKEFQRLKEEKLIIPQGMDFCEWPEYLEYRKNLHLKTDRPRGLSNGNSQKRKIPTDNGSAWVSYREYLLGYRDEKPKFSEIDVESLEKDCQWIFNQIDFDTRKSGPIKGLVMGSVQSGKTSHMIGLLSMAADYNMNIFIVLSGMIDSLRIQTRDRFYNVLTECGGSLRWHIMDQDGPNRYRDIGVTGTKKASYYSDDLKLNPCGSNTWTNRYVFVCLKNVTRLRRLIDWLHSKPFKEEMMRIIVIDDEADQASINRVVPEEEVIEDEDEIERSKINQLIINLVNGRKSNGEPASTQFQAMNYICFTATPYANVLNEAYRESLYPHNFVFSLPESKDYFGLKVIFGSRRDERYSGLDIVRTISDEEVECLNYFIGGENEVPVGIQKSVAWFLCCVALLRMRGFKSPLSMLIHTSVLQCAHFDVYETLECLLKKWSGDDKALEFFREVYDDEKEAFRLDDLKKGYPDYAELENVCDSYPQFDEISDEIERMLSVVINIEMNDNRELKFHEYGIHLCVDNSVANKYADGDSYLRLAYPDIEKIGLKVAPAFIVIGGNTISRGLTLEGLVCSYFARKVKQVDNLMQMSRWLGFRKGYELQQRIWMPDETKEKFELMEEIDERLKEEFDDFVSMGRYPSDFGPRIMSSSKIAHFLLTARNKSQNMVTCDFDFSGDCFELSKFENSEPDLKRNITITEDFLREIGIFVKSEAIDGAYICEGVDSRKVLDRFIRRYKIFDCAPFSHTVAAFLEWMEKMNSEGKFLKWNVAVAGNSSARNPENRWRVAGIDIGKIERNRKKKSGCIDIGSLRSGKDILSDVRVSELPENEKEIFNDAIKTGKNLIRTRYELGLRDIPLLLLYRIDHTLGNETKNRTKIGTLTDVVSFAIVLSGQDETVDCIQTVHINLPK